MAVYVQITKGYHRGNEVKGTFEVHREYKQGVITICAPVGTFGNLIPNPRVKVEQADFTYVNLSGETVAQLPAVAGVETFAGSMIELPEAMLDYESVFRSKETEQEAMDRIKHTFDMLEKIAEAVADGTIRGLVVSGPPGIGKSHGIEAVFAKRNLLNKISESNPNYIVISGNASAVGLYKTLYDYRDKKHTVIFDDCDGILSDDVSLNLLKAALDSGSKRIISWRSESRALANDDIPNSFEFAGSVIFLTNVNFDRTRESKIKHHLNAIRSRCHYLDLEIGTQSDMMLRIKQVIRDGMLSKYHLTEVQVAEIQEYIVENIDFLHELSLRTVLKIADFVKATPDCWKDFAEATCLKRTARFKRKLEELAVNEESNETE